MSHSKLFALLISLVFTLAACSKHKDPTIPHREKDAALQTALDELTRLSSYTQTGLNYSEYSDRLLNTKGNIDVALQRTSDAAAKDKIDQAVAFYLEARNAWKRKIDNKYYSGPEAQEFWAKASLAAKLAAEYAFADEPTRQQLDAREQARRKEELNAQVRAREQARQEQEQARQEQERVQKEQQARAAEAAQRQQEAEQRRLVAEQKRMAEDAERERIRRFAPEGTVYNLKLLSVIVEDALTTIPPGTELKVAKKNSDGTLHVEKGALAADVLPSAVTNDRDLAAALRSGDKSQQEALRQWQAQQAAAAAEIEAQKPSQPTPTRDDYPKPPPRYVNPLDRGPFRN